jgi:hypothetical protein
MVDIESELKELKEALKGRFSQLINLYRENQSLESFIKEKNLSDEYKIYRDKFYQDRTWKDSE